MAKRDYTLSQRFFAGSFAAAISIPISVNLLKGPIPLFVCMAISTSCMVIAVVLKATELKGKKDQPADPDAGDAKP